MSIQTSLLGHVQVGVNMAASNRIKKSNENGVVLIDLKKSGWSRDIAAFDTIYKELQKRFKSKQLSKDYTNKHFAKNWRRDFKWLYVRAYIEKGDGTKEFDPAEICIKCNNWYAANPMAKIGNNSFAMPRRILDFENYSNPPQKQSFKAHQGSQSHDRADGGNTATESDKNVFDTVYFEGKFNIAAQTHPFMSYLMHKFGVNFGNKLHSVSTAKKITIVVGCVIKSAVFNIIRNAEWLTFGQDGADIKDAMNIFYIWVRTVVDGKPLQLFLAARPEVRQFAKVLLDIFMDVITGRDINYGYDYRKKLEYLRICQYNEKITERARYNKKDLKTFKAPTFTNVAQEFNTQFPGSLTLAPKDVLSKTVCSVQDGANNMFAEIGGFVGLLIQKQQEAIGCIICSRVHCIDHEWDLWCDIMSKSECDLEGLSDIIEKLRKFTNYVDVYEELVSVAALYDVVYQYINKDFRVRWLKHLATANKQTQNNIDLLIYLLIWNINKIKHRNNKADKQRRTFCIDFFVYDSVLQQAAKVSVKTQSWSKTCVDAANIIDDFADFCKSRTGKDISSKILSRIKDGKIVNELLMKNINDLKVLSEDLNGLELIDEDFVIDIDITNHLQKDKKLATEYVEGIKKFKSYILWKCYRKFVDINYWDIVNIDQWLIDNKDDFIKNCCNKYMLKINAAALWGQYERFCKESIRIYGDDISMYDYYAVIQDKIKKKEWIERNKDLGSVFKGIFTEGFGNGMAESVGHIGNTIMDPQRKTMSFLYFDALCQIRVNGLSFEKAAGIVFWAIDFWLRAGYNSTVNTKFAARSEVACVKMVERYNNMEIEDEKEAETDYKRRLKAKKQRQEALVVMFNELMDTLKQKKSDHDDEKKEE